MSEFSRSTVAVLGLLFGAVLLLSSLWNQSVTGVAVATVMLALGGWSLSTLH